MNNTLRNLGDAATVTMGLSPNGDSYNRNGIGVPLLNGPTEFGALHPNCTLFTIDSKRECKRGDLIFCVRGSTTGRMNWADQKYSLGRGVCGISGETSRDTKYIRYCIEEGLPKLLQMAGGSTMPTLTQSTIKQFPIPYPSHRGKIAFILSAYDDLIENNMRRIRILEEMAQNLYREWFVKFRFPGHENARFADSPLGRIPEGWKVVKVGELLEKIKRKKKIKKRDYETEGKVPIVDQGRDFVGGYTDDIEAVHNSPLPVIVFGDHTRILKFIDFPFACGADGTQLLRSNTASMPISLFFYTLCSIDLSDFAYARHFKFLKEQEVLLPYQETAQLFADFADPIRDQVSSLSGLNTILRRTRDLLLPRLISGELNVSELDITIQEEMT